MRVEELEELLLQRDITIETLRGPKPILVIGDPVKPESKRHKAARTTDAPVKGRTAYWNAKPGRSAKFETAAKGRGK